AEDRPIADQRFSRPDPSRIGLLEDRDHGSQGRSFPKRHPHPGTDRGFFRQQFRDQIIQLSMDRTINDDAGVGGLAHRFRIVIVLLLGIDYFPTKLFRARAAAKWPDFSSS